MTSARKERAERVAVLRGGGPDDPQPRKKRGFTFHDVAVGEAGMVGGRFATESKITVTGSEPVTYPKLPDASPWANNPVGQEPPLGFSIDALEPTGTPVEVEQSLQELGEASSSPSSGPPDDVAGAPLGQRRAPRRSTSRKA